MWSDAFSYVKLCDELQKEDARIPCRFLRRCKAKALRALWDEDKEDLAVLGETAEYACDVVVKQWSGGIDVPQEEGQQGSSDAQLRHSAADELPTTGNALMHMVEMRLSHRLGEVDQLDDSDEDGDEAEGAEVRHCGLHCRRLGPMD